MEEEDSYAVYDPDKDPYTDEESCGVCGAVLEWERCYQCGGEGYDGHDCGEDVCCCLDPEENEQCEICDGAGGWLRCPVAHNHPKEAPTNGD